MATLRVIVASIAAFFGMLLTVPVVSTWLLLWLVAYLTRKGARLFEPPIINYDQLIEFAPTLGWKPKPNLNAHYLTMVNDGVFHTITDSQGWPSAGRLSDSNVVVFGDSYAFGYGVDARAAFWRCGNGVSIKSIGAPGYNMVQELLLMNQLAPQLSGKLVIWFIYFGNDLYDNLLPNNRFYRTPFVRKPPRSNVWEVTTQHVSPSTWPNQSAPQYYEKLAELSCATFLSERAYSACEFLIGEAVKTLRKVNARLMIMTIPDVVQITPDGRLKLAKSAPDIDSFDADLPDKKISEIAAKFGLSVVALKNHLTVHDYKDRDPHWNERGHQRVAEIIDRIWYEILQGNESAQIEPYAISPAKSPSFSLS